MLVFNNSVFNFGYGRLLRFVARYKFEYLIAERRKASEKFYCSRIAQRRIYCVLYREHLHFVSVRIYYPAVRYKLINLDAALQTHIFNIKFKRIIHNKIRSALFRHTLAIIHKQYRTVYDAICLFDNHFGNIHKLIINIVAVRCRCRIVEIQIFKLSPKLFNCFCRILLTCFNFGCNSYSFARQKCRFALAESLL